MFRELPRLFGWPTRWRDAFTKFAYLARLHMHVTHAPVAPLHELLDRLLHRYMCASLRTTPEQLCVFLYDLASFHLDFRYEQLAFDSLK